MGREQTSPRGSWEPSLGDRNGRRPDGLGSPGTSLSVPKTTLSRHEGGVGLGGLARSLVDRRASRKGPLGSTNTRPPDRLQAQPNLPTQAAVQTHHGPGHQGTRPSKTEVGVGHTPQAPPHATTPGRTPPAPPHVTTPISQRHRQGESTRGRTPEGRRQSTPEGRSGKGIGSRDHGTQGSGKILRTFR